MRRRETTPGSSLWEVLRGRRSRAAVRDRGGRHAEESRSRYDRFREILSLNDSTLQTIAGLEDRLAGRAPFDLDGVALEIRKTALDVFLMVKDLNQISGDRHRGLYTALRTLNARIEAELPRPEAGVAGPLVVSLAALTVSDAALAGAKMANLAGVRRSTRLAVPEGFAVTTAAFRLFMSSNGLWERANRLAGLLDAHGPRAAGEACLEVQDAIARALPPPQLERAILDAYESLSGGAETLLAVRSSAVGEDTRASHAGLYRTVLGVGRHDLLDAYRTVVASAYAPAAVAYRYQRGLTAWEAAMAVGCVRMLAPRCSGVLFSRPLEDPGRDTVVVSAVPGIADRLAAGEQAGEAWAVEVGRTRGPDSSLLSPGDLAALFAAARELEARFGGPQEVEWAIEPDGPLTVLQSRPLVAAPAALEAAPPLATDQPPILVGGEIACPGIAGGAVVLVESDADLDDFPDGGVLVARHSSPEFARVMPRCAAIVTDVGSPAGHMASLARENGVPSIVGTGRATSLLRAGQLVTVDAGRCRVFAGTLAAPTPRPPSVPADSPARSALRRIAALVTPLSLTDPTSSAFSPEGCRSLHDITRYVHENAFAVMFQSANLVADDRASSRRLTARLPIEIRVFDVGGGLSERVATSDSVCVADLTSAPLRAFLDGLLDCRVRWDLPRPVSARGFLSVLGESMAGPPAEALRVGRESFAIVSDHYLNFSTKAGYHFSTVDAYCTASLNKNYIHFRFSGGAADATRRARRAGFLSSVLTQLDFRVQLKGDLLVARLEKYGEDVILTRLRDLGRLTMCARQLDMLMDSDGSPDYFAHAFLAGELHKF
jgi:pyruvate, water dikinase